MRDITMCDYKDGKLSGEVLEDGIYYTIEPFNADNKNLEQALQDRLDALLVEWAFEAEIEGNQ